MATQLFITDSQLARNSIIDGSVDVNKYKQYIKIAQQIHIQNYLGTKLYDKISDDIAAGNLAGNYKTLVDTYINPMLIHFAMVDYLPFAAFQISNGGIYKHTSENSEVATKEEVELLVQKHREFAQFYTRRFIDYMNFNQAKFPEYYQATDEDMYPDRDATFMGIVL